MTVRLAVLADTHYSESCLLPERRGDLADILLLRAVHRLNRFIRPDATLLLGDLVDDGAGPAAARQRARLREVAGLLKSPTLIIPGNHDGDPAAFYRDLPPPPEVMDVGPLRLVHFLDRDEPGWNASRSAADIGRLAEVRRGHVGPLVSVQHVPLFPPGVSHCPYNFLNVNDILPAARGDGLTLFVSGHFHPGMPLVRQDRLAFVAAPALCETPFAFLVLEVDGDTVAATRHELAMPAAAGLFDVHVHTHLAYCQENMDVRTAVRLGEAFNLRGLAFAEHSGQLYVDNRTYWQGLFLTPDRPYPPPPGERMAEYLRQAEALAGPRTWFGLEVDCDFSGRPVVRPEDRARARLLVGAMHTLPALRSPQPDVGQAAEEFRGLLPPLLASGVQVLAHPFRVFRRARLPVPESLFPFTVECLRRHGVAAEINFHTNEPSAEFARQCVEAGVKLALGSDAHNLYEVGEFAPHLELLRQVGCADRLAEVLFQP